VRTRCDVHYSVDSMKVRGEGFVVLFRVQDELGEPLNCMWWVGLEESC
jgi:hypothetical protein